MTTPFIIFIHGIIIKCVVHALSWPGLETALDFFVAGTLSFFKNYINLQNPGDLIGAI